MTQDRPISDRMYHDTSTDTYHTYHDWESDHALFYTILTTLEAITGDEPTEMEPMSNVLDTEVLAQMFRGAWTDEQGLEKGYFTFTYHGCEITVTDEGKIVVQTKYL